METPLTAIELAGTIDEQHQLRLDEALPISGPQRVRVILLYPLNGEHDEAEWLRAAANSPAFADLANPEEDIYSLADGKPFDDKA
jgi:hypothetical protein